MIKDILKKASTDFDACLEFFKKDIASIRTNRAKPSLVEDVEVEAYGQRMRIQELASLSVPEPRMLLIQPWDKTVIEAIRSAIVKAEININPVVDGSSLRINLPQLTEERRKEFIKLLGRKTETARIEIRQIREHAINELVKQEKAGLLNEDQKFQGRDELQTIVTDYNDKIENLTKKKESELLS